MGFTCNSCGVELYTDDEFVSKTGKRIPLEEQTGDPHQCPNKKFILKCNKCKSDITFSHDMVSSKTGKKIPLDPDDMQPHQCNSDFKQGFGI